jgi:hypothetical protein
MGIVVRESNMNEIKRLERELYECALAVEQDEQLNAELAQWDVPVGDGLEKDQPDPEAGLSPVLTGLVISVP